MYSPRHPFRLNVGFLLNSSVGTSREFAFEYPFVHLEDLDVKDITGLAKVTRTPQGLLVEAAFSGKVQDIECVRCLQPSEQALRAEFQELYAFRNKPISDTDLMVPEDMNIDLEPLVREYLLLEVPISPVCKPDCKGLCIVCGADLNKGNCEHSENHEA